MALRFPNDYRRVEQWLVFSKFWWLYDASHQTPMAIVRRVKPVLEGKHKPLYFKNSDVGDHVVIYNTKWLAFRGEGWRERYYYHHTGYPKGMSFTPAWMLHEKDSTEIVRKVIYASMSKNIHRRSNMTRLHLYPELKDVPSKIMENIAGQLKQYMPVAKGLQDYSQNEIENFPKIWDM
ncbi:unnamed protein product [Gordionus sp. m RMFG-2023]